MLKEEVEMEIKGTDLFKAGFCVAAGVTAWKLTDIFLNAVAKGIVVGIKKYKEEKANEKSNV